MYLENDFICSENKMLVSEDNASFFGDYIKRKEDIKDEWMRIMRIMETKSILDIRG